MFGGSSIPTLSFRSEKYFENITDASPEQIDEIKKSDAIQVLTDNGAELVINLPVSNRISPRSKLALYKKTYGDFPKVNQKVTTKTDDNGFFRIVLEAS